MHLCEDRAVIGRVVLDGIGALLAHCHAALLLDYYKKRLFTCIFRGMGFCSATRKAGGLEWYPNEALVHKWSILNSPAIRCLTL